MQYQPDIHTISKTAPPSYAEATGQAAPIRESQYVPTSGQPAMYDQGCSQMSGHPSSVPAYQHPSNFYFSAQPAYNPSYVPIASTQQTQPAVAQCIIRTEAIRPEEKTCCEQCTTCKKKIIVGLLCTVFFLYVIKVIVSRSL